MPKPLRLCLKDFGQGAKCKGLKLVYWASSPIICMNLTLRAKVTGPKESSSCYWDDQGRIGMVGLEQGPLELTHSISTFHNYGSHTK